MSEKIERMREFKAEWAQFRPASLCICTHSGDGAGSLHKDTLGLGHGACTIPDCECKQFTWKCWTEQFEKALNS